MKRAVASLFALATVATAAPSCNFTYIDTANNNKVYDFDLTGAKKTSGDNFYQNTDNSYDYDMTVCDITNAESTCAGKYGSVCQYQKGTKTYVAAISAWGKSPDPTWSIQSTTNPDQGPKLSSTNGDPICFLTTGQTTRKAQISFTCDTSVASGTFVSISEDTTSCTFNIVFKSKHACAKGSAAAGSSSSDEGLGGSDVFVIILVVVLFVYFAGGYIYNSKVKGTSGMESLPNHEFWTSLPGLVSDGFKFVKGGCKKGGDASYDEL